MIIVTASFRNHKHRGNTFVNPRWPHNAEFGLHHEDNDISLSENYWVSGLCPLSGILNTIKHNVSETGSASVLR
jgi:hypothetical protein